MTQPSNYIELAHRTSAPIIPCIDRLRAHPGDLLKLLHTQLDAAVRLGDEIDWLKRAVFYGKAQTPHPVQTPKVNHDELDNARYMVGEDPRTIELIHAALGFLTESAEFASAILSHLFSASELDETNLKEEIGDIQWYLAKACRVLDTTLEQEQDRNIEKLKARFPDKFTQENATTRDLVTERKVLEKVD